MKKALMFTVLILVLIGLVVAKNVKTYTPEEMVTEAQRIMAFSTGEKLPKDVTVDEGERKIYVDGEFLNYLDLPFGIYHYYDESKIIVKEFCTIVLNDKEDEIVATQYLYGEAVSSVKIPITMNTEEYTEKNGFRTVGDEKYISYYDDKMLLEFPAMFIIVDFKNKTFNSYKCLDFKLRADDETITFIDDKYREQIITPWYDDEAVPEEIGGDDMYQYLIEYENISDEELNFPYKSDSWYSICSNVYGKETEESSNVFLCYDSENKKVYTVGKETNNLIAEDVCAFNASEADFQDFTCLQWIDSNGKYYEYYYEIEGKSKECIHENVIGLYNSWVVQEDKVIDREMPINLPGYPEKIYYLND